VEAELPKEKAMPRPSRGTLIITVDVRDFSAYWLSDGRPFERLWL